MKLKYVGLLGAALVMVLVVLIMQRNSPPPSVVAGGLPPANPAPSKENVSRGVLANIDQMKHAVSNEPTDAAGLFALARLLHDAHNGSEAAGYYARGLRVESSNHDARIDYALCLSELEKTSEALEQTRIVLKSEPLNAKACYNAGAIFANMGVHDSARVYWRKLIAAHPSDALSSKAREYLGKLSPANAAQ